MIPVYNDAHELIGMTMNSTTYSPEMLLTLIARLQRAEAEREQLAAELDRERHELALTQGERDALLEQVSDRESDLSYEYDTRVYAEAASDALRDLADGWACHAHTCAANDTTWHTASGRPDCTCGYDAAIQAVRDVPNVPAANTPLMRLVALGRASVAQERARLAAFAAFINPALTYEQAVALFAARDAAERATDEALAAALGHETKD